MLTPLNRVGDKEGCRRHADGSVTTPPGFKDAYGKLVAGGWVGASAPAEFGGQGLPTVLTQAIREFLYSSNMAFAMYSSLALGAVAAIYSHGSAEQKARYLPKLISGEWAGTMNLTEPQCGTDLGQLRCRATPQPDGSYKITGTKIFISAGEHDLTDNIIHLVLARIDGAPAGTKGISLFIVPKFLLTADGALGERNAVSCGSIEEKMGIHGNATCVMNYDGATGWLTGEKHRGLYAMFTMMNTARLSVGVQGLALSEVAYQNAVAYAKERLSGRAPGGAKFPQKAGRSDHRASGRAPHADDHAGVQRGGARAGAVDRAQGRHRAALHRRERARSGRRPYGPADAGDQRRAHRSGLCQYGRRRSRFSAATAISPSTAWSSSCATRASP